MIIKRDTLVRHAEAIDWGVGKVVEVAALKATIQFSDGIIRKIASSHYSMLQPADPALFIPIPEKVPVVRVRALSKRVKKVITPQVDSCRLH